MSASFHNLFWLIWKLIVLSFFLTPFIGTSYGLEELFHDYDAPQALAMGNAFTADAKGHVANYYNPAGLAKEFRRKWEIIPIAIDTIAGGAGLSALLNQRTTGMSNVFSYLQQHPGEYAYARYNLSAAVARRNFAVSLLGSYWYAGRSDGTSLDTDSGYDVGGSVGYGFGIAGNTVKFGVSARGIVRNQLKGVFDHSAISTKAAIDSQMKEGFGFGINAGVMLTLPFKWLPTLAFVGKDLLDTSFTQSNYLNRVSTTEPDPVLRSFNVAFSLRPNLWRGWKATFSAEFKNLELVDVPWQKRLHVGIQIDNERTWYFWAGSNQFYLTAGLGWRVSGGDLEIGTYGQDIASGEAREGNRRLFLRYTIDF